MALELRAGGLVLVGNGKMFGNPTAPLINHRSQALILTSFSKLLLTLEALTLLTTTMIPISDFHVHTSPNKKKNQDEEKNKKVPDNSKA